MKSQHQIVLDALQALRGHRADLMEVSKKMLGGANPKMYVQDFFAIAACKRAISITDGFCTLVESWNLSSSRALLRMQIDNLLRFAAVTLVEDQQAFITAVMRNERIDKLKDRLGNRLTDNYLVTRFSEQVPWLRPVYENTSGFVHLSGHHVTASIVAHDFDARTISWKIDSIDDHVTETIWAEDVRCCDETLQLFIGSVESWVDAKNQVAPETLIPDLS